MPSTLHTPHSAPAAAPLPCFIRELRDAIRAGRKTETRRVLNPQPTGNIPDAFQLWSLRGNELALLDQRNAEQEGVQEEWTLQQATKGGLYYLREPLKNVNGFAHYADDDKPVQIPTPNSKLLAPMRWRRVNGGKLQRNTLPQIHMPAAAARTFVRLKKIWTERLHAITEAGAQAEGVQILTTPEGQPLLRISGKFVPSDYVSPKRQPGETTESFMARVLTYRNHFAALWDSINAKREKGAYAWHKNPFVIVRQFQLEK